MLVRRELYEQLGGSDFSMGAYAGYDLCLRASEHTGRCVWYCGEVEVEIEQVEVPLSPEQSLRFYSRWAGRLWQNDMEVLERDGFDYYKLGVLYLDSAVLTAKGLPLEVPL